MNNESFKKYIDDKINDNFTDYYIICDKNYQYIGKNAIIKDNFISLDDVKIIGLSDSFNDFKPNISLNIADIQTFNNCYKENYDLF